MERAAPRERPVGQGGAAIAIPAASTAGLLSLGGGPFASPGSTRSTGSSVRLPVRPAPSDRLPRARGSERTSEMWTSLGHVGLRLLPSDGCGKNRQFGEQQWERRKTPGGGHDSPPACRGQKSGGGGRLYHASVQADPSAVLGEVAGMCPIAAASTSLFDSRRTPPRGHFRVIRQGVLPVRSVRSTFRTASPIKQKRSGRSGSCK